MGVLGLDFIWDTGYPEVMHEHDHPSYLCCPDVLSLVGDLSGNGCGSPNHIQFQLFPFFYLFYLLNLFVI